VHRLQRDRIELGDERLTERFNPRTAEIDRLPTREIVALLNAEDRTVADAVAAEAEAIASVVDEVADRLRAGGRLFYVGAGTSGRLGVLDAAECPPTFGTDPETVQGIVAGGVDALVRAIEGAEDDAEAGRAAIERTGCGPADFVLGIAASGTTPFVRAALEAAVDAGAGTGLLSCTEPPADLAGRVDHRITPLTGPEAIAGSTRLKAGTATKLVLNTITTGAMIRIGKVYGNLMVDLRATSAKLVDRSLRIVEALTGLGRAEAMTLLAEADGRVKTALAMHGMDVGREEAERRLEACDGVLAACLDRFPPEDPA
jgi:N-acetylmuramic acid 6-phosphate etherase